MARSGFGTVSTQGIQVRTVLMGMILLVSCFFYTKSKDEGFAIHQVVGWNRLGPQPAGSISLIGFDRWGCLVTSIEQATGIVASRAGRRTKPTVDWNPAVPLSHRPPNGAFHRTAEACFTATKSDRSVIW